MQQGNRTVWESSGLKAEACLSSTAITASALMNHPGSQQPSRSLRALHHPPPSSKHARCLNSFHIERGKGIVKSGERGSWVSHARSATFSLPNEQAGEPTTNASELLGRLDSILSRFGVDGSSGRGRARSDHQTDCKGPSAHKAAPSACEAQGHDSNRTPLVSPVGPGRGCGHDGLGEGNSSVADKDGKYGGVGDGDTTCADLQEAHPEGAPSAKSGVSHACEAHGGKGLTYVALSRYESHRVGADGPRDHLRIEDDSKRPREMGSRSTAKPPDEPWSDRPLAETAGTQIDATPSQMLPQPVGYATEASKVFGRLDAVLSRLGIDAGSVGGGSGRSDANEGNRSGAKARHREQEADTSRMHETPSGRQLEEPIFIPASISLVSSTTVEDLPAASLVQPQAAAPSSDGNHGIDDSMHGPQRSNGFWSVFSA